MRGPLIFVDGGVLVLIRATPNASIDAFGGVAVRNCVARLTVKVRAPPDDGRANVAIARMIAQSIGCKPSSVSIAAGAKDRDKTVMILGARIDDMSVWLDQLRTHGKTD